MPEILVLHEDRGYVEVVANSGGVQVGRTVSINVGGIAFLEEFHVSRSYRGEGIGSELREQTEKLAAQGGAKRMIRLGLFCDSPSIGEYIHTTDFLTHRGFRNFGVILDKRLLTQQTNSS